jgi:ribosomal protein S18 acetylase RimI-like enzyme
MPNPKSKIQHPKSPLIRPATEADYALIRRVARVTWAATYAPHITAANQRAFLKLAYSTRWLERRHRRPGARLDVAEVDERVVGYASTQERTAEAAELTSLYVLPAFHGQGVGTALLRHEQQALQARDIAILVVRALRENVTARHFYERHGFEPIEEKTETLGNQQIVEVIYGKWLSPPRARTRKPVPPPGL